MEIKIQNIFTHVQIKRVTQIKFVEFVTWPVFREGRKKPLVRPLLIFLMIYSPLGSLAELMNVWKLCKIEFRMI